MLVYEVDARVWMGEESRRERRPVTLESVPSASLDLLAGLGFRWLWLHSVWDPGQAGPQAARRRASWIEACIEALPNLDVDEIDGHPFAFKEYRARPSLGGEGGLEALRGDLSRRGMRLLVDFAAGWTAVDHDWRAQSPRYYAADSVDVLAPLDLSLRDVRDAVYRELEGVADRADGVFAARSTGGAESAPRDGAFWREAIPRLQAAHPGLVMVSGASSAPDEAVREEGFPHSFEDGFERRLAALDASGIRGGLGIAPAWGARQVRRLEAPGGERAASRFPRAAYPAAAVAAYMAPGWKVFHDGQIDGRRLRCDPRLSRRAAEDSDIETRAFYERLLEVLQHPAVLEGTAASVPIRAAWDGNASWRQFLVYVHRGRADCAIVAAINLGPTQAQCYADLSRIEPAGKEWGLQDLFSVASYRRNGTDLASRGLYIDLAPWDYNVFEMRPAPWRNDEQRM